MLDGDHLWEALARVARLVELLDGGDGVTYSRGSQQDIDCRLKGKITCSARASAVRGLS
jgi:hypothetical protein